MSPFGAIIVAVLLTAGCAARNSAARSEATRAGAAPSPSAPNLLARLDRTVCNGFCPVYSVQIDAEGGVLYEGRSFVFTVGKASAHLTPERIAALRRAIAASHFADLPEHCCDCHDVRDHAQAIVTVAGATGAKTIVDDHGCRAAGPAIRTLEDAIDEIVQIEKWIGSDDARRDCFRDHTGCPVPH